MLKLLTDLIRIEITRNGDYDIIEGIFSGDIVLYIVVGDRSRLSGVPRIDFDSGPPLKSSS